ncbi:MAG: hypothetical protein E7295_08340 [Lachnospiraceae bacterium]|jgi:GH25 family lysozyme M1 (1,4-beta-N-acetylmuramidase)|nr:hypothetical protein [Lachnospiraceae bacterium]
MKWNVGHTKRPQGRLDENRQDGYDWDEEGIDDFSYDSADGTGDYDAEPEYIELGTDFDHAPQYGAGEEYAQDADYEAEPHYGGGMEYASEPAYDDLGQDYLEAPIGNQNSYGDASDGYDQNSYDQGSYDQNAYDQGSYDQNAYDQGSYDQTSYDQGSYDQNTYDQGSYDQNTYDQTSYDQNTYDQTSYDQTAYDQTNYDQNSYDQGSYDQTAYDQGSYDQNTYDQNSYDQGGYDQNSYNSADAEPDEFQGDITYIDDYAAKPKPRATTQTTNRNRSTSRREEERGGFSAMDGIIAAVGIIAIIGLLGFIGWFVSTHKTPEDPHLQFANIGKQLQNIELIGGKGIAAVSNAELARLTPEVGPDESEEPGNNTNPTYNETDYANTVAVAMNLTSVQKDLKIKFSNRETSKLVGNVRFVASVTTPSGTTEEWVDDDMDGIIYKSDIEAGKYSILLKELTEDKYKNLILPATTQTVNVKKNIEYAKVDMTGEGKKESEINVNKEDTKKNETTVEGSLTDTVAWVASSTSGNMYKEVLKSTIPDPLTLPVKVAKNFLRTSEIGDPNPGNNETVKYTISFAPNGGTGSMESVSVEAGSFTLPDCGFGAPEGKEFNGWDQGSAGTPITVSGDVTITAQWKDKPVTNYTISFAANGGSGEMAAVTVQAGQSYPLPSCGFTAPEGKEFDKWDQGTVNTSITVNGDMTINAIWKDKAAENVVITFAAGEGGTGSMDSVTVAVGSYKLPNCTFTAPEGKEFDKWDKGAAGDSITVSANTTLTALWKTKSVKYEVTFDANGGSGTMDAKSVEAGKEYTLPECTFTAPSGKKFSKWDKGAVGEKIKVEANVKLVAQWVDKNEKPIELTFKDAQNAAVSKVTLRINKKTDGTTTTVPASIKVTSNSEKKLTMEAISTDRNVVTAAFDANDKSTLVITAVAKGTAKVIITADYEDPTERLADGKSKVAKEIEVVVTDKDALAISLDKTELACYSEVKETLPTLEVTIKNSNESVADLVESKMKFTAESSDGNIALITKKEFGTATADGTIKIKLTITPQILLEKKSCIITVKYEETGAEPVSAKCTLTVKPHPKYDRTTLLLDNEGRQLFVSQNNGYREAVYADYYVDGTKFFVQSGVKYTGWQTINGKVYYYSAEGKFVTGEQVIQGAKYTFGSDGALMTGNGVLGIDVSRWNGSIDWKAVKNSGVSFVIIRCGYRGSSEGALIEDPKFTTNIKGAVNAGLKVGIYFFTQAINEREAVYEASYVIDKIKNYKITYPVFLDVEPSGGRADKISKETRTNVCKAFCQTIQNAGYTAGIYANKNWLEEKIDVSQLNAYKIWLAQYAAQPTYTGRYDMWQYKSTGVISGISGNVDLNLSYMGY